MDLEYLKNIMLKLYETGELTPFVNVLHVAVKLSMMNLVAWYMDLKQALLVVHPKQLHLLSFNCCT